MLARSGPLPVSGRWAFEPKLDGFRAIVGTRNGFQVRSRRGWLMGERLPELRSLPKGLILDGELVAFGTDGKPDFPLLAERMLHGRSSVPIRYMVFDLLEVGGFSTLAQPYEERRRILEELELPPVAQVVSRFEDGEALFDAVQTRGLEGVVAKRLRDPYRSGQRAWVKTKNPAYWRLSLERDAIQTRLAPMR